MGIKQEFKHYKCSKCGYIYKLNKDKADKLLNPTLRCIQPSYSANGRTQWICYGKCLEINKREENKQNGNIK